MHTDSPSDKQKIAVNRHLVLAIWIVCLGLWGAMFFVTPGDEHNWRLWQGGFVRVGLVMFAVWLALPTKYREAAWVNVSPLMLAGMLGGIVAAIWRPKVILPLLAILGVVAFFLRPRKGPRDNRPDRSSWQR